MTYKILWSSLTKNNNNNMFKIFSNVYIKRNLFFFVIFIIILINFLSLNSTAPIFFSTQLNSRLIKNKGTPFFFRESLSITPKKRFAHSPSLTKLDHNHLLAVYSAGTREGAPDVKLYSSIFDIKNKRWTDAKILLNREKLFRDSHFYIRKLGNAVIYKQNKIIHLFVVAPSIAGWGASRIYHYISLDHGKDFKFYENLILSPMFNISTLVRTQPIPLLDNGFLLPVYHENESNYPLFLKFSSKGDFLQTYKINDLKDQIQPTIAVFSEKNCLIGFRNHDSFSANKEHFFKIQFCQNNGKIWSSPINTNIKNEDESINLIYFNREVFLIHTQNNMKDLVLSKFNLETNKFVFMKVLDKTKNSYFKYPNALVDGNFLHIMYTDNHHIKHIMLNASFLKGLKI